MTIGIGLICSNGIVLGSDTLHEGRGTRVHGRKLWMHSTRAVTRTLIGAGSDQEIRAFRDRVFAATRKLVEFDEIRDEVSAVTSDFYLNHVWTGPNPSQPPQFLFALRASRRVALFTADNSGTLALETKPFTCIGSGSPVAEYLAATLFRPLKGIEPAELLAAYILKQAKSFGEGCGGETHLATVALPDVPMYVHGTSTDDHENYFDGVLRSAADLAYLALDGVYNDALQTQLDEIQRDVIAFREAFHQHNFYDNAEQEHAADAERAEWAANQEADNE